MFRHLNTPLRRGGPELDRHAWLEGVDAYVGKRRSMEKSIAGPVRELDKAVPLNGIVPFHLAPNRGRGRFAELWLRNLRRDLGMARSVTTVCFSDDLLSTLTNQPASLYEIRYGFKHARLRKIDSRHWVSAGQLPRRGEKLQEATAKKHPMLILDEEAEIVSGKCRVLFLPAGITGLVFNRRCEAV
jgi:hypothetical protein